MLLAETHAAAVCVQDPAKRPTARSLLEHRFFKHVPKDRDYMRKHLISGLPDVITRVRHMKDGVKGLPFEPALQEETHSNQEYVRGLSAWNFDVAELKRQARLRPAPSSSSGPPAIRPLAVRLAPTTVCHASGPALVDQVV